MVAAPVQPTAMEIRVRGRVQGVGFRPTVWRFARDLELAGEVLNDAEGVLIRVAGAASTIACLINRLRHEPPPLARIDRIESRPMVSALVPGFRIVDSMAGSARTEVAPDAALCRTCAQEIADPAQRRHRYAFANCTHCGPRLSIVRQIPYDRAATTMAAFPLCDDCRCEYQDPADRRFHAEAIACHACGPRPRLVRLDPHGAPLEQHALDDMDAACTLLQNGCILAVKGLGGYQLACDATNATAVARLRAGKQRETKPFALMARDLDIVRRYCRLRSDEARQLAGPESPIVLLRATEGHLPDAVAPGLTTLGFMLPTTPLHQLLLGSMDRPVVMTSGNTTDEPQIIDDGEAMARFPGIADFVLLHDRPIAVRLDDSIVRVMDGAPRVLRRGRGFAPAALALPPGFATAPDLLAAGAELKCTFCLLKDGQAVLSQHIGDLEDARTLDDYRRNLDYYASLYDHVPTALAVDSHPDCLSSKLARARALEGGLPLIEVQHHHAHVAACLAENLWPLDARPVLGIALDGLGWGDDGTIWGGEFLLADYRDATRLGTFKPVPMPGGAAAIREPWRNLYGQLTALPSDVSDLEPHRFFAGKPCAMLDRMIRQRLNAPMASSCGRLFDAVAAAVGICRDRQGHEGEAASRLEALACERTMQYENDADSYPFAIAPLPRTTTLCLDPQAMWRALLHDLTRGTPRPVMAARFHKGLAIAVVSLSARLAQDHRFDVVALSGGCWQNAVLFEESARRLRDAGFMVLAHTIVPTNDGGLALGQAVIAAARLMAATNGSA
jgi:hydrogenase maturation protein HypF